MNYLGSIVLCKSRKNHIINDSCINIYPNEHSANPKKRMVRMVRMVRTYGRDFTKEIPFIKKTVMK